MSGGYASRLSDYKDKGICGLPENFDTKRAFAAKTKSLCVLMNKARHVVVITGAGVSTGAGIPDFRGPHGVWTKEEEARSNNGNNTVCPTRTKRKRPSSSANNNNNNSKRTDTLENFADAKPTICHQAITKLVSLGKIHYCVTQNVDGLHRRAGLSRNHHSSVHGCVFTEKCESCGTEVFRDFDVGGMSFQPTGRNCALCQGVLRDTLLDWEDALPEDDFDRANDECEKPGTLVLCLGTSLRIEPVGSLPLKAEKYVIVNLQKTPQDEQAALIIRASVDDVMNEVMALMGFPKWQEEEPPQIERVWKPANKGPPEERESAGEEEGSESAGEEDFV